MAKRKKGLPVEAADAGRAMDASPEIELANPPEEFTGLGQANLAAFWRANAALSEAFEAVNREAIEYVRSSLATAASTATALLGAKTLDDVFQLNAELAKANMLGLIEGTAKLSEIGAKFANETLVPLSGRLEATMQRLARPLAA